MSDPVCTAFLLCDGVVVEKGTEKNTLVGTFHSVQSPQFPFGIQRFFAHVAVTNLAEPKVPVPIAVNIKQKDTGAVVASFGVQVPIKFPPQARGAVTVCFNVPFVNVIFPAPGEYVAEVIFNNEPLAERILSVRQMTQNPPP